MYKFHEEKNQHPKSFKRKKEKYNKFREENISRYIKFLEEIIHKFHEQKSAYIMFHEEKPTCNEFPKKNIMMN